MASPRPPLYVPPQPSRRHRAVAIHIAVAVRARRAACSRSSQEIARIASRRACQAVDGGLGRSTTSPGPRSSSVSTRRSSTAGPGPQQPSSRNSMPVAARTRMVTATRTRSRHVPMHTLHHRVAEPRLYPGQDVSRISPGSFVRGHAQRVAVHQRNAERHRASATPRPPPGFVRTGAVLHRRRAHRRSACHPGILRSRCR